MPRTRVLARPPWYTAAMRRADARLAGTWFRCPDHGPTEWPLVLGPAVAYCPAPDCFERVVLVSRAPQAGDFAEFNGSLTAARAP